MAININGQVLRNVPEQVSKNVEDIEDLQDRVTDLENGIIGGDLNVGGDLSVTGSTSGTTASYSGAIGAASAAITGNASVGGNLTVGGSATITGNLSAPNTDAAISVLKGNSLPASFYPNEGDLIITPSTSSFFIDFAHWRVSNGKLSIVIEGRSDGSESLTSEFALTTGNVDFDVPNWVYNSLVTNSAALRLDTQLIASVIRESGGGSVFPESTPNAVLFSVIKTHTLGRLRIAPIYLETGAIPADNYTRNYRYEAHFIL